MPPLEVIKGRILIVWEYQHCMRYPKKIFRSRSRVEKNRRELVNFRAFMRDHPVFGDRILSYRRGADPPDFICRDLRKAKIGVELVEWIEQEQTNKSKKWFALDESYKPALGDWRLLTTKHVGMLKLYPKEGLLLQPPDTQNLHDEVRRLILEKDEKWSESAHRGD